MKVLPLLLLGLLLPSLALALPATTGVSNPTIVVGIIATLSGPEAVAGQDTVDGFTTAMRHLGGRFANQEVRVVVQDDKGSPDAAQQAVKRMLEREKVDFVLVAVSQAAMAAIHKPLIESRAFILNLDAAPASLAGMDCSPWLFEVGTPPDAVMDGVGTYLTGEKMRRIAVIGPDSPVTDAAVTLLRRSWAGEVSAVIRPRHGAMTYAAELAKLRQLAPDAVLSLLTGGMAVAFVRDFGASGLKSDLPMIGLWPAFERPQLSAMTDPALDILNVGPWSPDLDTPLNKRLNTDFELEYGRPVTSWVAQGYDAGLLLDAAMKATGGRTSDRDAVRNALRRAEFTSVRGAFRFDTNHVPSINVYLRRVTRDGKGRMSEEVRSVLLKDWHGRDAQVCPMRWVEEPAPGARPGQPGAAAKPGMPAKPGAPGNAAKPPVGLKKPQ